MSDATLLPDLSPVRSQQAAGMGQVLSPRRLMAFASVMVPISAAQVPILVYLPALYAQHFGLSLSILGAIFLAERIWGAISDPLIGTLSDRTQGRYGRRKPWIIAGAVLFGLATIFLFFPGLPFVTVTPFYLAAALFSFYLAWSMIQIPYLAWSGELSGDYHERTRIAMFQGVAAALSLFVVLLLPTVIDQFAAKNAALKLAAMGCMILLSLPITLLLALRTVADPPIRNPSTVHLSLMKAIGLVLKEGPLIRLFLSDFAVSVGQGIRSALFIFFVTFYMGLPKWASGLFLLQFIFGIAAAPLWAAIARRLGKHQTAVIGELAQLFINLGLLLVVPHQLPLLLGLTIAQGLSQGSGNLMLRSMVADVADQHRLETGADRTALFFSVFSISLKAGMAVAVGIAFPLVAWFGFHPAAAVQAPAALRGLAIVFAVGPAIAHLISAAMVYRFPIGEVRHAAIRAALQARCEQSGEH
jgi:Na+/melibiose symporter-like transporter